MFGNEYGIKIYSNINEGTMVQIILPVIESIFPK